MASQLDVLRGRLLQALDAELQGEINRLLSEQDRTLYALAKRKGIVIGLGRASEKVKEILASPLDIYAGEN